MFLAKALLNYQNIFILLYYNINAKEISDGKYFSNCLLYHNDL